MNQSLLSIGVLLSLGTVGCAGFGVQHSSSLTPQYSAERGVDSLWLASEEAPTQDAEVRLYADQELGTLWDFAEDSPSGILETGHDERRGSDLWNPASVSRPWEIGHDPASSDYRLSQSSPGLWY